MKKYLDRTLAVLTVALLAGCTNPVPDSYTQPYGGRMKGGPTPAMAGYSGVENTNRIANNDVDGDNARQAAAKGDETMSEAEMAEMEMSTTTTAADSADVTQEESSTASGS